MAVKSTFKNMAVCLSVICLVCSALLAGVYVLTAGPIDAAAKAKTANAIAEVTPAFDSYEAKSTDMDGVTYPYYQVCDASGNVLAYAIQSTTSGFGGALTLMVGVTTDGVVYNTSVLSHSETPGLGAKCTEPKFHDQFAGWNPSEKTLIVKKDGGDVDAITASTITSRAYTLAVANAVKVSMLINAQGPAAASDVEETNDGGQDNE